MYPALFSSAFIDIVIYFFHRRLRKSRESLMASKDGVTVGTGNGVVENGAAGATSVSGPADSPHYQNGFNSLPPELR